MKKFVANNIGTSTSYYDEALDKAGIDQLVDDCCLPANKMMLEQIVKQKGNFKVSYSLSGVLLELLHTYRPDAIRSFKELAATGCVEFLSETYYNSLSSLHSAAEFQRQVVKHDDMIEDLFGLRPAVFRNTELIHNNKIAELIAELSLEGILCEGVERILQGRSCNKLYRAPGSEELAILLRNQALSDDIAFRFGDPNWSEHPLTAEKFAGWLHHHPADCDVINLFMDYETLGIHKTPGTGIFDFLSSLPAAVLQNENFIFSTASEVIDEKPPTGFYDVVKTISWEDRSMTNCVWTENMMQNNTLKKIYSIDKLVLSIADEAGVHQWGRLQAADYFYWMDESRKNCCGTSMTAREAYQYYSNMVADFEIAMIKKEIDARKKKKDSSRLAFNILSN
jgi:alpha-amylase